MKQWKRKAAAIFAAATLCGALPAHTLPVQTILKSAVLTAHADDVPSGYCGDPQINNGTDVSWKLEDGTLTISGTGAMEDYPVEYPGWNDDRDSVTNVVIENGVTSIGEYAFYECRNLTAVTIPGSVTSIDDSAFAYCISLTAVNIPDSVTSIGKEAFFNCSSLTSVTIPDSVTSIGYGGFFGCSSLKSVILKGETPPQLDYDVFNDTPNNLKIYVPEASVDAYKDAWSEYADQIRSSTIDVWDCGAQGDNCTATLTLDGTLTISGTGDMDNFSNSPRGWAQYLNIIVSVVIKDGVTNVGDNAFYQCSNLISITIPGSVTSIGESAFERCTSLASVNISDGVTQICDFAFYNCTGLTSVTIPNSVTSIGTGAFANCSFLTAVTLDSETPPSLGGNSFSNTHNDLKIYVPASAVDNYKTKWSAYADRIVANALVWNCGAQGDNCIAALTKDGTLTISGTGDMSSFFDSAPGWNANRESIVSVVIEDGVTNVGDNAFYGCSSLTSVTIPDSVTSIGVSAFDTCRNLSSVTIPDSVTNIGDWAFCYCSSLTSVNIPDSVKSIGDSAFEECGSLTSVTLECKTPPELGDYVFDSTHNDMKIYVPASEVDNYKTKWSAYADRIVAAPLGVWECGAQGDNCIATLTEDGTLTISGTGAMDDYPVGDPGWYDDRNSVTKVVIENGVTSIGGFAFYGFSKVTSVTIPETVKSIGEYAFAYCSGLTAVDIPDGVTSIGGFAFYVCSKMTSVTIPETVTSIGEYAFTYCSSLTAVDIPDGVENIADGAFSFCTGLTSVTISDGVTSIGAGAFSNCSSLTAVDIPDSVTKIEGSAFYGCSSLISVTLDGETPPTLGSKAFNSTHNDLKIYVPASEVDNYKTKWSDYADRIVAAPLGVWECGDQGDNCIATLTDDGTLTISGTGDMVNFLDSAPDWTAYRDSIVSVVIEDGVTNVGDVAFYGCRKMTSVTIPETVTSIGKYAFAYCSSLTAVDIPYGVTSIGEYAFYQCSNLISITIPGSVTSIENAAFAYCISLNSVTIPDSVTKIVSSAFYGCSSLESVTLEGVTPPELGIRAFNSTHNDMKIYVPASAVDNYKTKWSDYADRIVAAPLGVWECGDQGDNCIATLTDDGTLTISGTGAMADYIGIDSPYSPWYSYSESITSVVIENGVTNVGDNAFYGCSSLTSVTIPDSVTSIGVSAFDQCSNLTSVDIPDSVTSIGEYAFCQCSNLISITIPGSVISIGLGVFYNCSSLTDVTIPDSVTSIGASAFYNCSSLTDITIPDSVTSIGTWAFAYCSSLTVVDIPDSVTKIVSSAFYGCSSLESVVLEGETPPELGIRAFDSTHNDMKIYVPASAVDNYKTKWSDYADRIVAAPLGVWECGAQGDNCIATLTEDGTLTISGTGAMAGYYSNAPGWYDDRDSVTNVVIEDGVTNIGAFAFIECSKMTSVTIPDSVTSIGAEAFYNCSSLTGVTIPDSVTKIEGFAFYGCSSLISVTIPDSVTSIGVGAFYGCSSLTAVDIPNSVNGIEGYAFAYCSSLTVVDIPDSVTKIEGSAFYDCSSLISVTLDGETPPMLGYEAFDKTHNDLKIYVPAGTVEAYKNAWSYYADRIVEFKLFTEEECRPVISNGVNKVRVGFTANVLQGKELVDYGLIYYNSGDEISAEQLTLENVGGSIKKAKFWRANITDHGYGVVCVGFVQIRNADQTVDTYYTGNLGGSFAEMTDATQYVTFRRHENKALISDDKQKVYVGFDVDAAEGYTVEDYGLIYYNSGNAIQTEHLTLENVGVSGIKTAKYWAANITDNGYGVKAVGFVKVKDSIGCVSTLYTEELGSSFAAASEAAAANAVDFIREDNKAVVSSGKEKVYVGFDANLPEGYSVEDYGLIYCNSGDDISAEQLTLDNVGGDIKSANYWKANITDNGFGVTAVGFVKVKDANGYVSTLYTEELGGSFTEISEEAAANAVTFTREENQFISSGGKDKIYVGFSANLSEGYTVEDYGLIYCNTSVDIYADQLTLENVGGDIKMAQYWKANITNNGFGVTAVGFVKVKDANGFVTTLYTEDLGAQVIMLVG